MAGSYLSLDSGAASCLLSVLHGAEPYLELLHQSLQVPILSRDCDVLADVRGSALGFIAASAIVLPWTLTFAIGKETGIHAVSPHQALQDRHGISLISARHASPCWRAYAVIAALSKTHSHALLMQVGQQLWGRESLTR